MKRVLLICVSLVVLISCNNFFKTANYQGKDIQKARIDSLNASSRYFILRTPDGAYAMKNIRVNEDQKQVYFLIDTLPREHTLYMVKTSLNDLKYRKSDHPLMSEVHIYTHQYLAYTPRTEQMISLDSINRMEVLIKDQKRTTESHILGVVGGVLAAAAIATMIIALTKSSCPFIIADNGSGFMVQGEVYGGAIYPQLVRTDHLPLKIRQDNTGKYVVKISNELKEKQYTDHAALWVIRHPGKVKVLATPAGALRSVNEANLAIPKALLIEGRPLDPQVLARINDKTILAMNDTSARNGVSTVEMRFDKPKGSGRARLLLCLKNSYFLDYLYGELAKGFGAYYASYMKEQEKKTATELLAWVKDQKIPLEIYQKKGQNWKKIEELNTIGPVAMREILIPIQFDATEEELVLQLRSGFFFWELDAALIDYSPEPPFRVEKLAVSKASDEKGLDVTALLQEPDNTYLEQPFIGNVATLEFQSKEASREGETLSFIFESRGYYQHIRDFAGKPDLQFLRQFSKPGAFPLFGLRRFCQIQQQEMAALTTPISKN